MKIKNSERIFFICAIVLNLLVLGLLTAKPLVIQKSAEKNERILRLKCNLYDPYDPMKGRYVRLTFDENNKNVKDIKFDEEILFEDNRKENENKSWRIKIPALYAVFENNEEGVSVLKEVTLKKPSENELFMKTPAQYFRNDETIYLDLNFSKYYMQEEHADILDKMTRNEFEKLNPVLEIWLSKNGEAIQKKLVLSEDILSE